jgi:uncharacterized protein
MNNDVFPALTNLMREAIGDLLAPALSFSDMCADDVIFEAPYAPGGSHVIKGREGVAAYMPKVVEQYAIPELHLTAVHRSIDSSVVIIEFVARNSTGAKTGLPYPQVYINVIKVQKGEIVQYRDYWNPDIARRAIGEQD